MAHPDLTERPANEAGTSRSRGATDVSGVEILPIPPALEFPYPQAQSGQSTPDSTDQASSNQGVLRPITRPKKSATTPIDSFFDASRSASTPEAPNLLRRIGSAPIKPSGSKKLSASRPRAPAQRPSLLQRLPSGRKKAGTLFFNPDIYSGYEESSESEDEGDDHGTAPFGQMRRTYTAPHQGRDTNDYKRFAFGNDGYKTRGHVSKHDGRLNISLHETAGKGYLAKALGASLRHHLAPSRHAPKDSKEPFPPLRAEDKRRPQTYRLDTASTVSDLSSDDPLPVPKLNIVVMVIGSRGDIQPFLRLGKILKEDHGHRVRIATHPTFKQFVEEDAKLEFFDVGGDPAELMAFMVKNPGLIPKTETIRSGEIPRRRAQMFEMFQGFWRACIDSSDHELDPSKTRKLEDKEPFVADAIIANPPCFAHIHCAERLGIPLHLMFTFPNTPTQQFPHPLTNIKQSNVDANYTNFMSYPLVEMMQWQGLGDLINEFRVKTLGLDPMSLLWAPGQLFRMKVPYSYLWSPGLIPKPPDWGTEINITGFVFLDLASSFKPPEALVKFLDEGEPPVYIGFGSIVVDDPDKFTHLIFEAVKKAGVRALVSKGWGGLGAEKDCPENIFLLDNTPHDWLFPRVSAVVHHGGAGTTAIGLKCGKPTMIVPFFGDQPFWGAMVAKSNAGAEPIPYRELSAEILAESIKSLLTEEKQKGAKALADKIAAEGDGAVNAVKSFHKHLPTRGIPNMRCSILRDRVAAWHLKGSEVRLSSLAALMLVQQRKVKWSDLRLIRVFDWNDFEGPGEPLTGAGSSLLSSMIKLGSGIGKTPYHWAKIIKQKDTRNRKRRQSYQETLQAQAIKKDQRYRKQNNDEASDAANMAIAEQNRSGKSSGHDGDAGAEAKLPAGNQPDGLTQTLSRGMQPENKTSGGGKDSRAESKPTATPLDPDYESDTGEIFTQLAAETARGLRQSGSALAKLPMEFFLAIALGFHNAPRLYGDDTVRATNRITGFHSGCRAATDEFFYGVFDGVTGVVRQPYIGAKYDGVPGFFKGIGKGAGGLILKDAAAIFGLPAYVLKGVHKEMTKHRQPTALIRRSRMAEGVRQYAHLSDREIELVAEDVAKSWDVVEDVNVEISRMIQENGFKGRVEVWRNRRWLKENGIMENVRGMQRALDAHREGRDWEVEFREEKARHQQEQARALRARKEARRKKYERDERGKRMQGPDVRLKTRHGTYRALKRFVSKAEKRLDGNAGTSNDTRASSITEPQLKPDDSMTTRPRAGTNMANEATGTSAIDQVFASGPHGEGQDKLENSSPSRHDNPSSPNHRSNLSEDGTVFEVSPTFPRHRGDSGETLVQPNSFDFDSKGVKRASPQGSGLNPALRSHKLPTDVVADSDIPRMPMRTATA